MVPIGTAEAQWRPEFSTANTWSWWNLTGLTTWTACQAVPWSASSRVS